MSTTNVSSAVPNRHSRERFRERSIIAGFAGDIAVVTGSLLAAYHIKFNTSVSQFGVAAEDMTLDQYAGHIVLGVTLMMGLLANFRLYAPAYLHSLRRHVRIICQASVVWVMAYLAVLLILKVDPPISRIYCVAGGVTSMVALCLWRKLFHLVACRETVAHKLKQRVLFVGWSEESTSLLRAIENEPNHIYDVVGIVPKNGWELGAEPPAHINRLGDFDNIGEVLQKHEVDMVLLTDLGIPKEELLRVALECEKAMVEFKLIPNVFQVFVSGLHLENLGGIPLLGVSRLPLHSTFNSWLKRAVDILGGLFGLLLSAPIIGLFGLMIKLEDGGPIFYRQRRTGRNGKDFWIFKIRSMRLDSEKTGAPGWTVKNDPRCLRVGAFMRKWNIDEVPQFWNVLTGEMSLVGPRPERPELIARFKEEICHYNARHNIKPGITGWAQVNGLRGDTDLRERVKFDIYYIENWNLWLDFQIMAMTFFKRDGAC